MGHGGHRKRAEGMNRRKEVLGIADKEEGHGRREPGNPEQEIYRRRGAVQAGGETEPYYTEKNGDAGRRQSYAGGKRNAEEMHRQESTPGTEKLMKNGGSCGPFIPTSVRFRMRESISPFGRQIL